MARTSSLKLLPLLALTATAGCGTFGPDPQWAPVKRVQIGASDLTMADGYYADAYRAIVNREYGRALDLLQLARRGHENDPRILNAFGVVYDKLGRFDLSARYYAQALAADPNSWIVKGNLAYSQQLQQHWSTERGGPPPKLAAQALPTPAAASAPPPVPPVAAPPPAPAVAKLASPPPPAQTASPSIALATPASAAPIALLEAARPPSPPPVATPAPPQAALSPPQTARAPAPVLQPATASGPGPTPVGIQAEIPAPHLAPVAASAAAPTRRPETAQAVRTGVGPWPYAVAFKADLAEPPLKPASFSAPPPRRPGSLVLLDASGQALRVRSVKTRLTQLGWSAGGPVAQVAPPAPHSIIRYPAWRQRVAQALARTLPGPVSLESCGRACSVIQVVFGADVRRWRLTPNVFNRTSEKAKT
jgi:hypothetical protein